MKNLKILVGAIVIMSFFSCEINELPNDDISNEELDQNTLLGVGDQHGPTEDRKGL